MEAGVKIAYFLQLLSDTKIRCDNKESRFVKKQRELLAAIVSSILLKMRGHVWSWRAYKNVGT